MISEHAKESIDSLSKAELRLEIEKGRDSRFQGEKYAYLKVRLTEFEETTKAPGSTQIENESFFRRKWSDAEKWLMTILATVIGAVLLAAIGYGWTSLRTLRSVEFTTEPSGFGLSAEISGRADVKAKQILVRIEKASFTLNNPHAREAAAFRAVLAKAKQGGSWEIVGTSVRHELGFELMKVGDTKIVNNLTLSIPITKADAIAGHYLMFDIDDCNIGKDSCGTSHAHTRPDLF